jgi:peroxiredoxin
MSDTETTGRPVFAGRIGVTLLCVYLFGVTLRIGGCYEPEPAPRDEIRDAGPAAGAEFPSFTLRDVNGVEVTRDQLLAGARGVIVVVPSLDWSPPTKAHLLDLAEALRDRGDVRAAVVLPQAQATPRSLAFVRDRRLPFVVLIDDSGLIERLGLATAAPDGTPSAHPATFVLDATGRVQLRDVRKSPRAWLDADTMLDAPPPPRADLP